MRKRVSQSPLCEKSRFSDSSIILVSSTLRKLWRTNRMLWTSGKIEVWVYSRDNVRMSVCVRACVCVHSTICWGAMKLLAPKHLAIFVYIILRPWYRIWQTGLILASKSLYGIVRVSFSAWRKNVSNGMLYTCNWWKNGTLVAFYTATKRSHNVVCWLLLVAKLM